MINTEVVSDSQGPGKEFSFICIAAGTKCIDDFDEYFLENVFSKIFILYKDYDGSENPVLVLVDQVFQGRSVSVDEKLDQLLVGKVGKGSHKMVLNGWIYFS